MSRYEDARKGMSATDRWTAYVRHAVEHAGSPEEGALVRGILLALADQGKLGDTDRRRLLRRLEEGPGPEDPWERITGAGGLWFEEFIAVFLGEKGYEVGVLLPRGTSGRT